MAVMLRGYPDVSTLSLKEFAFRGKTSHEFHELHKNLLFRAIRVIRGLVFRAIRGRLFGVSQIAST